MAKQKQRYFRKPFNMSTLVRAALLLVVALNLLTNIFVRTNTSYAATSSYLNFQARLLNSAGNIVPDGDYNIEYKIYDSASSGASAQGVCVGGGTDDCQWVETRTGANKITLKNGYFSVQLGLVASLPSISWDQDLWLTMNIGGSGSPSWDGEMTPRIKLTAVPYALAAGQLAKLTGSDTSTLAFDTQTAARSILLPDASGTVCLQTSSSCGFATGSGSAFLQGGNSFTATAVLGTNDAYGLDFEVNNTTVASLSSTGAALFKNSTNSTTAFQIQNSSSASLLTADTTNNSIAIASTAYLAAQRATDYSTTGSANDVNLGNASLVRLTGASAQTITGIAGGADGRILTIVNAAGQAATLSNNSGSSTAANRIITGSGSDLSLAAGASISLIYDSGASFWRVVGGVAGGAGTCPTCANQQLSNLSSVAINTALLPGADNTIDLGSSSYSFRTLYSDTSVLTPNVDVASAGTLSLGTSTATAITIGKTGITTTNAGALTVSEATNLNGATLTIGDASGDAVTVNSSTWTFANDTNFALSGGINGLSFDTDTLSIDGTNDRVGIGTAAPGYDLHIQKSSTAANILIEATGADADVGLRVKNDVQEWRMYVAGSATDSFIIRDVTNGKNPFVIEPSAPTNSLRIASTGDVGIGTVSPDAKLELAGNASKSAWGLNGIQLQASSATYTDSSTSASGTATNAVINSFATPTLAASNTSVTTTNAATVYIQGAPTAGTNQTITNAYAMWVDGGTTRMDGDLIVDTNTLYANSTNNTVSIGTTTSYGVLHVQGGEVTTNSGGSYTFNSYWNGANDKYVDSDSAFAIWHDGSTDRLVIESAASGTAGNNITYSEILVFDAADGSAVFKNSSDSNTAFAVQKNDGTSLLNVDTSVGNVSVRNVLNTFDQGCGSCNSIDLTLRSGNATGATSNSGNITMDVGTATGTAGTISIGTTNSSGITVGSGSNTFSLQTSNIDISSAGAISGVTGYTQSSGAFAFSGAGNFSVDSAAFDVTTAGAVSGITTLSTSGILTVGSVGTASNDTVLCRNGSSQIASCNSTFLTSSNSFLQGGNSFTATAVLGTNDAYGLDFEVNNTTVASLSSTGAALFKNSTNSTTAFQVQPAASSTPVFNVDTTNSRIGIGNDAPTVKLDVTGAAKFSLNVEMDDYVAVGNNSTTSSVAAFNLGHIFDSSDNCIFGCYGVFSSVVANNPTTPNVLSAHYAKTATSAASFTLGAAYGLYVDSASLGAGSTITNNYGIRVITQTAGASDFGVAIEAADTQTLWLSSNADNTTAAAGIAFGSSRDTNLYRSAANTLKTDDSFAVGTNLTVTGTSNFTGQVTIGTADTSGIILVLDVKTGSGDPTGTNGAMYYNSNYQTFRCFRGVNSTDSDGQWENCGSLPIERGYEISEEFMYGTVGGTSSGIGANNWNAETINGSACQTLAYDLNTAVDRPGVLRMRTNGSTSTGGCAIQLGNNGNKTINGVAANQVVKMALAVGGTSSTSQIFRAGIHSAGNGTISPIYGVWWEADPSTNANWRYCYGTGAATCNNSSTAIAADTFVSLEIRVKDVGAGTSSADFFIDGTKYSITGASFATAAISPNLWCKAINATAQNCYADYFQLKALTSGRR